MNLADNVKDIIQAIKQGHEIERNFELLYVRFYAQVYRFFLRKKIRGEIAEELTQNTFFSVYNKLKDLRQDEQFEIWLWQIARREMLRKWERERAQKRQGQDVPLEDVSINEAIELVSFVAKLGDSVPNPQEQLLNQELKELIHTAMQQLPEQMRRCLELRLVLDMQYQEIAQVMGISINTVKSHLFQAREQLRKRLGGYFKEIES